MTIDGNLSDSSESRWLKAIESYYEQTNFDYKRVWHSGNSLAFHFGYYACDIEEHRHALVNANHVLSEIAHVTPGDRVLDAGCGLGGSGFWLAENKSAVVVGITPVKTHVLAARKIAQERLLADKVSFYQADYACTSF